MSRSSNEESFLADLLNLTGGGDSPLGDDCAIIDADSPPLLATVDTMVSRVHFEPTATDEQIARKLVGINLSDIAAMGGIPRWSLLSLTDQDLAGSENFFEALVSELRSAEVELVGGDLSSTRSDDGVFSLTVLGRAHEKGLLRRGAARPGDRLVVSGTLGCIRALLASEGNSDSDEAYRLYDPPNRLKLGRDAVEAGVRAGMDVSDGLVKDLGRMLQASGVGARLDPRKIPVDPIARSRANTDDEALQWALDGGEDFELLLAVQPDVLESFDPGIPLTIIGQVTEGDGINWDPVLPETVTLDSAGYDHFD